MNLSVLIDNIIRKRVVSSLLNTTLFMFFNLLYELIYFLRDANASNIPNTTPNKAANNTWYSCGSKNVIV